VMEFVISIASIVHREVHAHKGSAPKNIGDAFLLGGEFPEGVSLADIEAMCAGGKPADDYIDTGTSSRSMHSGRTKSQVVMNVADSALASFVVIMTMMKKSAFLRAYGKHEKMLARMPGYECKMGFGLHVGWGIEGAVGSTYKVDASYLSPNVNMAARLEAATKQFGTPLLLTSDFANILTPNTKAKCRQIDKVTVKGSIQPIGLCTYDVDLTKFTFDPEDPLYKKEPKHFSESFKRIYDDEFEENPDITTVRGYTQDFLDKFGKGYQHYLDGKWKEARTALEEVSKMRTDAHGATIEDGPTMSLLRVMAEFDFQAPSTWRGYRELTEK